MDNTKDKQMNEYVDFNKRTRVLLFNKVNEEIYQLFPQGADYEREKKFYKSVISEFIISREVEYNPTIDNYNAKKLIKDTFLQGNSKDVLVLLKKILDCLVIELKAKDNKYDIYEEFNKLLRIQGSNVIFRNSLLSEVSTFKNEKTLFLNSKSIQNLFSDWGTKSAIVMIILTFLAGANKISVFSFYKISFKFLTFNIADLFVWIFIDFGLITILVFIPYFIYMHEKNIYESKLKKDFLFFLFKILMECVKKSL